MLDSEKKSTEIETQASAVSSSEESHRPQVAADLNISSIPLEKRQLLHWVFGIVFCILVTQWLIISRQRPEKIWIERSAHFATNFVIEINSASWLEWAQLEGIGEGTARRIVVNRLAYGPFQSIDDVARVPGIGPTTLDRIRPQLTIRHEHSETPFDTNTGVNKFNGTASNIQQSSEI